MGRRFEIGCSFGVMQGRLSVQSRRGYQTFPWGSWEEEFDLASERSLEHIEWVLDPWNLDGNPLLGATKLVKDQILQTGVNVITVCADYLMNSPLDAGDSAGWTRLRRLLGAMQEVGAKWLVLPCVDEASLRVQESLERLKQAVQPLTRALVDTDIKVAIECDLDPVSFRELLGELEEDRFSVNYDIGNSAALGFQATDEFDAYGSRISVVHVKDRVASGGSVPLGTGNASIPDVLKLLLSLQFAGPVTMQAFRDELGVETFDRQLVWFSEQLKDAVDGT